MSLTKEKCVFDRPCRKPEEQSSGLNHVDMSKTFSPHFRSSSTFSYKRM